MRMRIESTQSVQSSLSNTRRERRMNDRGVDEWGIGNVCGRARVSVCVCVCERMVRCQVTNLRYSVNGCYRWECMMLCRYCKAVNLYTVLLQNLEKKDAIGMSLSPGAGM